MLTSLESKWSDESTGSFVLYKDTLRKKLAVCVRRTVGEVMPIIVTKCIGATKAKIKDSAIQISLMYVEIEKQDHVLEELLKGAEHKNPKIAAACVSAIAQALR